MEQELENNEEELKEAKEDAVIKSAEFRMWRSLAKANQSILDLLCEVVALASSDDEDDDFEEVDEEEE